MDGHRSVGANVERLEERKGDSEGVRASEQRKRERERERERD